MTLSRLGNTLKAYCSCLKRRNLWILTKIKNLILNTFSAVKYITYKSYSFLFLLLIASVAIEKFRSLVAEIDSGAITLKTSITVFVLPQVIFEEILKSLNIRGQILLIQSLLEYVKLCFTV